MRKQISSVLWKIFLFMYAVALTVVVILCVMETQEKVPASAMATFPLVGILLITVLAFLGTKIEGFLDKYEKYLLFIFFVLYTIATVRFTLHSRANPTNDSLSLIEGALYMAGIEEEMNWTYFARWDHQIMPALFLSFVFRFSRLFHVMDVWYFAWALNIVQVLITLYCVYRLCHRYSKHGSVAAWLGMGMMAIYVPIWGHTQSLYTDAFSFGFGIIAFYVWLCNYEKRNSGLKYWLINIGAGIIWGIGFEIKATSIISMIAVVIYLLLFEKGKVILKNAAGFLLPVLLIIGLCSSYIKTLPSMEYEDTWGLPKITSLIGIGLEDDGSFRLDSEYLNTVSGIAGMEEKKAYTKAYILENIDQFWNPEHVVAKLRYNFASGKMKADDFMQHVIDESHGFLYNCISYQGAYRRTYRKYVAAYWYMLLEFIVIACVLRFFADNKHNDKKHKGKEKAAVAVPLLSVCGIMIYVMIVEANNRLLYNHIPMIFSAASIGIWSLYGKLEAGIAVWKAKKQEAVQAAESANESLSETELPKAN